MADTTLIGFGGHKESGKDTAADHLVHSRGFYKAFMSEPLSRALYTLNPIIPTDDGFTSYRELVARVGYTAAKTNSEVRRLLQTLGTEVGRDMIDEDVWVTIASRTIAQAMDSGQRVAITGIRFRNELDMITALGGRTVWVERPGHEGDGATASHTSEMSLGRGDFDEVLINDGTILDLHNEADRLVSETRTVYA